MLPLRLRPRGNIKLPRADIFNSHPAHRLSICIINYRPHTHYIYTTMNHPHRPLIAGSVVSNQWNEPNMFDTNQTNSLKSMNNWLLDDKIDNWLSHHHRNLDFNIIVCFKDFDQVYNHHWAINSYTMSSSTVRACVRACVLPNCCLVKRQSVMLSTPPDARLCLIRRLGPVFIFNL